MNTFEKFKKKVILDFRETEHEKRGLLTGQYAHVVDNRIYYQVHDPLYICYAEYDNERGVYIKPENNCVLKNSMAGHNFRVFKDKSDEKYPFKAVGGYHTNKRHPMLKNCDISKKQIMIDCYDPVWPNEKQDLFSPDLNHPRHANGFYVFKSVDGLKWELFHDRPILNKFIKCEDLPIGTFGSDCVPSVFYDEDKEKYILYARANVKLGVRHVLYTESTNLIDWSQPKLIKSNPPFDLEHGNFYYSSVYKYDGVYVAFPPFFENYILDSKGQHRRYKNEKTLIMTSKNGFDWKIVNDILQHDNSNPEWGGHMRAPHVLGFEFDDNSVNLYVQENFLTKQNKLFLYSVKRKEFDKIIGQIK